MHRVIALFLIKTKYLKSLDELSNYRNSHLNYFKELANQKKILVGGRMSDSTGAIIIALVNSLDEVNKLMTQDPYFEHNLASYEVVEFDGSVLTSDELKKMFNW